MATTVSYVGNQYSVPAYNDTGYAQGAGNLSSYLVALATGSLTLSGGTFTLTADANFGANFGLVALYYKSRTANIASAGILRLANTDSIAWRNAANAADLLLAVSGTNILTYGANALAQAAGSGITLNTTTGAVSITAPVSIANGGTNSIAALANTKFMVSSGGAIVEGPSTTLPIANGGTNSGTSLNSNRFMVSTSGAIVEAALIAATKVVGSDANGLPTSTGIGYSATKLTGLSAGSANGDSVRWEQINGFRILQIVSGSTTTPASSTSGVYADTNLSASITPTSSSSKILVFVRQACEASGAGGVTVCSLQLLRGAGIIYGPDAAAYQGAIASNDVFTPYVIMYLDSPATTSATTYKTQFARSAGANTVSVNDTFNAVQSTSVIWLFEIG